MAVRSFNNRMHLVSRLERKFVLHRRSHLLGFRLGRLCYEQIGMLVKLLLGPSFCYIYFSCIVFCILLTFTLRFYHLN